MGQVVAPTGNTERATADNRMMEIRRANMRFAIMEEAEERKTGTDVNGNDDSRESTNTACMFTEISTETATSAAYPDPMAIVVDDIGAALMAEEATDGIVRTTFPGFMGDVADDVGGAPVVDEVTDESARTRIPHGVAPASQVRTYIVFHGLPHIYIYISRPIQITLTLMTIYSK
jgi:hypothetical protein